MNQICFYKGLNKIFLLFLFVLFSSFFSTGQNIKSVEDLEQYGYSFIEYTYKGDKVDILIRSKKGQEQVKKPLFFFCQGSLPQPLIKIGEQGMYPIFPFNPDSLSQKYHLVIVSKPYIPLFCDTKFLDNSFSYNDTTTGAPIKEYAERNLLDYYIERNLSIIKYLQKQEWVSKGRLVIAGHSEGGTIAAKMAEKSSSITHLILSGENIFGRIMSIILHNRAVETDSLQYGENQIEYWKYVVKNKTSLDYTNGDTPRATYEFSEPLIDDLEKLKIPVLVSYGTKDNCMPYIDYLRVDLIRKGKTNFTFKPYIGTEHNFFPVGQDGKVNHSIYNWQKVADDWLNWLNNN